MMNSKDFNVTTVSGNLIPRNKCRLIQGEYYEMGINCFLMPDNRWHRINNGKIAFDNEKGSYVLLDQCYLIEGIIGLNDDKTFKYGFFSANPVKNIIVNDIQCISEECVTGIELKENLSTGSFMTKNYWTSSMDRKAIKSRYSFDLDYSAGPKIKMFSETYNLFYKPNNWGGKTVKYAKELNDKTFGFEIETSNGQIPERYLFRNGLIPLRDGSLKHDGIEPFEYTTIPLSGAKGVGTMIDVASLIQKYTEISKQCSLHLHIGGYKQTKQFVVALHRVMLRIQDEVYSMFPTNYKYTSENGFKQKDYCAPIKDVRLLKKNTVDQNFDSLFNYYSGGNSRFVGFGYCNHPKDNDNRAKWGVSERYSIVNIIPFIWGKSGTCEWRCHVPTQNPDKMINWLFICNAIMSYADKYQDEIASFGDLKDLNLNTIFADIYSPELASVLNCYAQWRKDFAANDDATGSKELEFDLDEVQFSVLR